MPQSSKCETCHNLEQCDEQISWQSLLASADHGCAGCALLRDGICGLMEGDQAPEKLELVVDMSLFVYAIGQKDRKVDNIYEFYMLSDHPVVWSMIGPARPVSTNSSSQECISLAKRWLEGCLSSHEACKRKGTPTLPTRVIEVGASDEETRLFVPSPEKKAEYAALSHCWGLSHPITLTKATLESMQERIVFNESSKTFKQAVDVTRRLGIPYLWIDSLCILQDEDDKSDWAIEAPKMSTVYNCATVTISAASSIDTSSGLFPDEEDRAARHKSIKLASTSPSGDSEFVFVRTRSTDHFKFSHTVHSSLPPERPKLRTRGWVLQEDYLSPRILHFRKEELSWTCSTYSRCECRLRPALPLPHPFRAEIGTLEKSKELTASLDLQWPLIVMEYTRRTLTRITDRVAALSGLATYMESQTTDTYYCGIWYEDMAFQMLWYVNRKDCPDGIPSRFPFPYAQSWSWMSIPGPVSYYERYPAGHAPSHPAIQSADAIQPHFLVLNVGRIPKDWNNLVGTVLLCPAALIAHVIRVKYHPETKRWEALDPVDDFNPENLRISIDTLYDEGFLASGIPANYIFILVGRWVGQGMTFLPMQAVCIVARGMPLEAEPIVDAAARFQVKMSHQLGRQQSDNMILPTIDKSFERVGLIRGAGSIDAWKKAVQPEVIFLF